MKPHLVTLWDVPGALVSEHTHLHIRPVQEWRWRRIGVCIGLPLYTIAAFVIVGWGGPK